MRKYQGGDITEVWGGLLGLLVVSAHVGRECWCSRGPCRSAVVATFQWKTACAGTIGGPSWNWGTVRVTGLAVTAQTALLMAFSHRQLWKPNICIVSVDTFKVTSPASTTRLDFYLILILLIDLYLRTYCIYL